ncbi:hypothetical protein Fot_42516 [Forsythia ovata]|uniref:Uncharacterized protein n=1 Tax=Forsythia ovata TaxID=205694 RepID=A0ABD1RME0_9LAMI
MSTCTLEHTLDCRWPTTHGGTVVVGIPTFNSDTKIISQNDYHQNDEEKTHLCTFHRAFSYAQDRSVPIFIDGTRSSFSYKCVHFDILIRRVMFTLTCEEKAVVTIAAVTVEERAEDRGL